MFCTNCGAKMNEGQKFCTACGTPVDAETGTQPIAPAESSTSGIDVMATPAGQAATVSYPTSSPQPAQHPAQGTAVMPRVSESAQAPTVAVAPASAPSSTSTRTVLLVVIVVLLILIVAALALFFGLQLGGKESPATPATSSQSSSVTAPSSSSSASLSVSSSQSSSTSSSSSASKLPASNKYHTFTADYVCPDSNTRTLTRGEISSWSEEKCNLARNEIYARHGRIFDDANYREYFDSKSWYKGTIPAASFDTQSLLSDVEKTNADLLLAFENERGYALS